MARLALVATVLTVVVVMLGAWTRLVHAGLGCPDWPGCYGFLSVPQSAEHIAIAEARFPHAPVDVSKGWPEMIHRYAAGTLSLLVFTLAGYGFRHRREGLPWKHALFIAGFVVLQAAFGMWTVTLKLWPQVVALHLLGGFTTLSLLFLLTLRLRGKQPKAGARLAEALARMKPWVFGAMMLVIIQIALGAWTAANYAAVACTDLPTCHGEWWPQMDFRHGFDITQAVGPNYLGGQLTNDGRVAIHVTHRFGALVLTIYLSLLLIRLWPAAREAAMGRWVALAGGVLLAQVALGVANVLMHIPLPIAVAHNALGAGLLLAVVNLLWRIQPFHVVRRAPKPARIKQELPA
ncbi:COX15/CtaA family protein [Marinobacter nanhaiticus D15-8W]|uniref:Heme A synthase n=2 Tax=Marinobacter TaxID=2742 RepID=N6WW69_9GAMM|nr:COX15/CtaA family protein [Marinobacter nanhaiticus]ENO15272.1 heme A synthase [Marinobacter nanhaiticus D15-8W]BES69025.1 COX15/CtaA family protein [Marinobacter nanhaiticus D15-8W]